MPFIEPIARLPRNRLSNSEGSRTRLERLERHNSHSLLGVLIEHISEYPKNNDRRDPIGLHVAGELRKRPYRLVREF